jgi:hypothetical protein
VVSLSERELLQEDTGDEVPIVSIESDACMHDAYKTLDLVGSEKYIPYADIRMAGSGRQT